LTPPDAVVDPPDPERAFLVWTRLRGQEAAHVYFSSSQAGGRSWGLATPAYVSSGVDLRPLHNVLHVFRDGTLLDTFVQLHTANSVSGIPKQRDDLLAIRSVESGQTWSAPIRIGDTSDAEPQYAGRPVSAEPIGQADVAPAGTVYAGWADISSSTSSRVLMASSHDEGRTWSTR